MSLDLVIRNEWHPVIALKTLEEKNPLSILLLNEPLVIWKQDEQIMAFQDLCIHRGTMLSLGCVSEKGLQCPYHGWTYNPQGQCVYIPAHPNLTPSIKARVKTYRTQVKYGLVWVCLGEPQNDPAPFPEWDDDAYRKVFCGPYDINASGPRVIENFLDVSHFPFIHAGILGIPQHAEVPDYVSEINQDGVISKGVSIYQPDPYGIGAGDHVDYTYRVYRPLTAYFIKESLINGMAIILFVTPHSLVKSTVWMWMAMNYGHELPEAELSAFQDKIFQQDRAILESQRPAEIPLDLTTELNMVSDRTSIMYRKWLRELQNAYHAPQFNCQNQ